MCSEHVAKIALNAVKVPQFEAFNGKSWSPKKRCLVSVKIRKILGPKLIKQQILLSKKLHSLKPFVRTTVATSVCKDDSGYITQLKQQYYLAAHRHIVNVLASNIIFFIFAVLVAWCSHCRPYKLF